MREIDLDFLFTNLTPNVACVRAYILFLLCTFGWLLLGTYWTYRTSFMQTAVVSRYIHWEYVHLPSPPLPLSFERCGFKADVPMWRKVHTRGHHQCKDRG